MLTCLRKGIILADRSPANGEWVGEVLYAENKKQLWIIPGIAYGFLTLSDTAKFPCKTTDYWSLEHERTIIWSDTMLDIDWPTLGIEPRVSKKI